MAIFIKIKATGRIRSALLVLSSFALLGGSLFVWLYVRNSVEEQRNIEFVNVVEKTEERVQDNIKVVVERLYDLRGFVSSGDLTQDKWQNYLMSVGVETRYPGLYTFAFGPRVEKKDIEQFVEKTKIEEKSERFQSYTVFPTSQNAEVIPIKYIFSSDSDLGSLLGYDIGTSETQVAALKTAVADDKPVITDLLHLGLVMSGNTKVGYVVMLPVYSQINIEKFSKEEKRQYFVGLVGSWIFPSGFLTQKDIQDVLEVKGVSLSIIDGDEKVFSTHGGSGDLKQTKEVVILDKKMRFEFVGNQDKILGEFTENLPWVTLIGLMIINTLWIATVWSIMWAREMAEKMAIEATKDLRKFKQAVEGVSDLVVITDNDGTILYVNKAAEKITGYRIEAMIGKNTSLWGQQMDEEYYQKFWKTIKEDKKPFWGEITNRRKNGDLYEAEINVSPILDEWGNLLFFVGIEKDLSKIKAVEKIKTEFISLASHQLRTPLSAVKWFGKMLIDGDAGKLSQTQKEYVEKINESNEREIRLVNSLLNVSRIESGKITIDPKQTNLNKLIESLIIDFKVELENTNKKLRVIVDKKIPLVVVDEDLIRHVYSNFISNAIRYTKKDGRIVLKVFLSKNRVISEVKDNGIGIPKSEQKRVFDKFFRASNALKKETDGNGLGLYLSKTIVESSGGKIGFRSGEGKGSTFWFSLPIGDRVNKGRML